jgi:hypothetical protein
MSRFTTRSSRRFKSKNFPRLVLRQKFALYPVRFWDFNAILVEYTTLTSPNKNSIQTGQYFLTGVPSNFKMTMPNATAFTELMCHKLKKSEKH